MNINKSLSFSQNFRTEYKRWYSFLRQTIKKKFLVKIKLQFFFLLYIYWILINFKIVTIFYPPIFILYPYIIQKVLNFFCFMWNSSVLYFSFFFLFCSITVLISVKTTLTTISETQNEILNCSLRRHQFLYINFLFDIFFFLRKKERKNKRKQKRSRVLLYIYFYCIYETRKTCAFWDDGDWNNNIEKKKKKLWR